MHGCQQVFSPLIPLEAVRLLAENDALRSALIDLEARYSVLYSKYQNMKGHTSKLVAMNEDLEKMIRQKTMWMNPVDVFGDLTQQDRAVPRR